MMRKALMVAAVAFLCIAGANSPPVTFESPCECRDNHGQHRFHEKGFKLGFGFILDAGDWDRASMRTRVFILVQI
jgi:hypothetical protein